MKQIAFVFEDLNASQSAYLACKNMNRMLENTSEVEPTVFFMEQSLPCVDLQFARYHVREALLYTGNLVSTSLKTAISVSKATRARRYFYIQDLEWLRPNFNKEAWLNIMQDRSIKKICRSVDHAEAIHESGFGQVPVVIENYNIEQFLELFDG
jgi:hypothetical protein